jgi:hypothetical protein
LQRRINVTAKQLCPIRSKSRWLKFLLLGGGTHNKRLLRQQTIPQFRFNLRFPSGNAEKGAAQTFVGNLVLEKYLDETEK